jgi:hypothetical protein
MWKWGGLTVVDSLVQVLQTAFELIENVPVDDPLREVLIAEFK